MISPAADLSLFIAVTATALIPWLLSDRLHVRGYYILAFVALANGPHLISTWMRVYLSPTERFKRPIHYWLIPAFLAAFAIASFLVGGAGPTLIRTVLFYWASWHFAAQSWGVLRLYQRRHRAAAAPEARLEKALVFLPALYCVLRRVYTGPWTLFGVEIAHPRIPAWIVNALLFTCIAMFCVYLAMAVIRRVAWIRPLFIACSAFGFAIPFNVIRDGTSAFAAAALWHAIQYIGIVWLYNRRRYANSNERGVIAWVSRPGRTLPYIALIALCAFAVYALAAIAAFAAKIAFQQLALALWTALTLGHYYLDGVIWKTKRYDLNVLANEKRSA